MCKEEFDVVSEGILGAPVLPFFLENEIVLPFC